MWIFGYGSLVWKVDFPYVKKVIGYIKGYERKFWQASIDHRGVPEKPGRVVTLVPSIDTEATVWGVVYEIDDGDTETIASLNEREKRFSQIQLPFHPSGTDVVSPTTATVVNSFNVLVYIGAQDGPLFLGDATVTDIVCQIAEASGPSGLNSDYVFNLAKFMRSNFPHTKVWGAAYKIHRADINRVVQHLDLREVMGYEKVPVEFYPTPNHPQNVLEPASPLDYNNVAKNAKQNLEKQLNTNTKAWKNLRAAQPSDNCQDIISSTDSQQSSESELDLEVSDNESHAEDIQYGRRFTVMMYYGSSENEHYLGPSSLESMAQQIFECIGPSGKNKEYLYNLAKAMRQICAEAVDSDLAKLEAAVRDMEIQYNLRKPGTPIEL